MNTHNDEIEVDADMLNEENDAESGYPQIQIKRAEGD